MPQLNFFVWTSEDFIAFTTSKVAEVIAVDDMLLDYRKEGYCLVLDNNPFGSGRLLFGFR